MRLKSKFLRCLIWNRSDGRLIYRVSSYDNRLISFSKFSPTHPSTLFTFSCQMYTDLTFFQRIALKQLERSPHTKRYIYSVHVLGPLVHISQGLINSKYDDQRRNVLTIGDMVLSSISNTKSKQKYGKNTGPQNNP